MFSYNYLCVFTLFKKEVYRFFKVGIQTIIGPAISSLLFLAVFTLALGRSINQINNTNLADSFSCFKAEEDGLKSKNTSWLIQPLLAFL